MNGDQLNQHTVKFNYPTRKVKNMKDIRNCKMKFYKRSELSCATETRIFFSITNSE